MQLHTEEEMNSTKFTRASGCVRGLNGKRTDVWRTICVIVIVTRTEMVLQTSVHSPFNHLTQLLARQSFTEFSR
jgi:hypothetical protein